MKEKLAVVIAVVIMASISWSGCITETPSSNIQKFEVHEWGVFLKGYDCNETSVLGERPSETIYDRKPVIYFHSLENSTKIAVEVNSVKNATVIPTATIEDDKIIWDVTVENDTIVLSNGTRYPYLFYEGETIGYCPTIVANITTDRENATFYVKNKAGYEISDVYFIYGYPTGTPSFVYWGLTYIRIDRLEPEEEKTLTVPLKNDTSYNTSGLLSALVERGLTSNEAKEMIDYWSVYWFYPTNTGNFTRLFYIVPQSAYDELLPIEITPEPDLIKRVGIFTITDIPMEIS